MINERIVLKYNIIRFQALFSRARGVKTEDKRFFSENRHRIRRESQVDQTSSHSSTTAVCFIYFHRKRETTTRELQRRCFVRFLSPKRTERNVVNDEQE